MTKREFMQKATEKVVKKIEAEKAAIAILDAELELVDEVQGFFSQEALEFLKNMYLGYKVENPLDKEEKYKEWRKNHAKELRLLEKVEFELEQFRMHLREEE